MIDLDLMECQALATAAFLRFLRTTGANGIMLMEKALRESCRPVIFDEDNEGREVARRIRESVNDSIGPEETAADSEIHTRRHPNCSCGSDSRGACIVHSKAPRLETD